MWLNPWPKNVCSQITFMLECIYFIFDFRSSLDKCPADCLGKRWFHGELINTKRCFRRHGIIIYFKTHRAYDTFDSYLMIRYVQDYNVCAMLSLEQFSVEFRKLLVLFVHLHESNWFRNLAPCPTPVRRWTKTCRVSLAHVHAPSKQAALLCLSFDWFPGLSVGWLIKVISLILVGRHSIENCSKTMHWHL